MGRGRWRGRGRGTGARRRRGQRRARGKGRSWKSARGRRRWKAMQGVTLRERLRETYKPFCIGFFAGSVCPSSWAKAWPRAVGPTQAGGRPCKGRSLAAGFRSCGKPPRTRRGVHFQSGGGAAGGGEAPAVGAPEAPTLFFRRAQNVSCPLAPPRSNTNIDRHDGWLAATIAGGAPLNPRHRIRRLTFSPFPYL